MNFTIGGHGDSNIKAQLYLIDHLVKRAARFTPNLILKINLLALLYRVDCRDIDRSLPGWARRSRAAQAIALHFDSFRETLGPGLARLAFLVFARTLRSPGKLARTLPQTT